MTIINIKDSDLEEVAKIDVDKVFDIMRSTRSVETLEVGKLYMKLISIITEGMLLKEKGRDNVDGVESHNVAGSMNHPSHSQKRAYEKNS